MDENVREFPQAAQAPAQTQGEHRAAPRPQQPRKKKKTKRARVLQRRLIVLATVLVIFFVIFSMGSAWGKGRGTKLTNENVTTQLAALTTLSSTSYHYTNVERFENVEDFYGWDASDYSSGFTLSYSGVITAAIDPTKIHNELGWLPETKFADGIKKTIQWYLDNKEWWETIISGEYQNYYEKMYGNR